MAPVAFFLGLLVAVAPVSARVMDRLHAVPKGWEKLGGASDEPITLRIALQQQNALALEQAVLEISTPGHPNYGMHMTRDEVRSYTAPSKASTLAVTAWLHGHHIKHFVDNDWVTFTTTAGRAGRLLNTTFDWYRYSGDSGGGSPKLRTLSYSVPDELTAYIDLVQPTTRFGQLGAKKSNIFEMHPADRDDDGTTAFNKASFAADDSCNREITPTCLRSLYNINYTASVTPENKVAFTSYLEQYARYEDLASFIDSYYPQAKGHNFSVELVNGGLNDQNADKDSGEFCHPTRVTGWRLTDTIIQRRQILMSSTSLESATLSPLWSTALQGVVLWFRPKISHTCQAATSRTSNG